MTFSNNNNTTYRTLLNIIPTVYFHFKHKIEAPAKNFNEKECNQLLPHTVRFDFSLVDFRYAYLYRYFTCLANAVKEIWLLYYKLSIHENSTKWRWHNGRFGDTWFETTFSQSKVKLFSIGGGPGFDVVGLVQSLVENNVQVKLDLFVVDEINWFKETGVLYEAFDERNEYGLKGFKFLRKQYTTILTKDYWKEQLQSCDIISIVKFFSSLCSKNHNREFIIAQFQQILLLVKPTAYVFFLDDSGDGYLEMMLSAATTAGLKLISQVEEKVITVPENEERAMRKHFDVFPEKSVKICASLWQNRTVKEKAASKST